MAAPWFDLPMRMHHERMIAVLDLMIHLVSSGESQYIARLEHLFDAIGHGASLSLMLYLKTNA